MSKRLQVSLPDEEMEAVRKQAKMERLSVGDYVRKTLRGAESPRPSHDMIAKLKSVREAAGFLFPTAEIDQMNREIERGYETDFSRF